LRPGRYDLPGGPTPTARAAELPTSSYAEEHGEYYSNCHPKIRGHIKREKNSMLLDILIAILIVAVATILGLVVHPILWVLVIVAVLWLFGRNRSRSGKRGAGQPSGRFSSSYDPLPRPRLGRRGVA
jgi:hypothetical protein